MLSSNLWTSCEGPSQRQSAVLVEDKRREHGETPTWCSWVRIPIHRRVRKIAKSDYQISHICLSVCMPGTGIPLKGFSWNWIFDIFPKSVEKIQVSLKSNKNNGTLHEDRYTFLITCGSVLHIMRNVSHKSCRRHQNTHFTFNNLFPKIMPLMGCGRKPGSRKGIPCWTHKSTNTHSAYVTLIAFPPQQWLHERVSSLRYTHIGCRVLITEHQIIQGKEESGGHMTLLTESC